MAVLCQCGKGKNDRDLILEMIGSIESLAEKKYTASILDYLSDDFSDLEGRSKDKIEELLNHYFENYSAIVVNLLGTRFLSLSTLEAAVETDVSLSSGPARIFRKLVPYSGQTYRFTITLKKTGGVWKIGHARWQAVFLEELFPESIDRMKSLFPRLNL